MYKIRHKKNKKIFAAKRFKKSDLTQKDKKNKLIELLKQEVKVQQDLEHKNVVKFNECHETENSVYLVFEFIPGGTLSPVSGVPISWIRSIIKQILEALFYLEKKNIVHRDIKPENILLGSGNGENLKLIDFGFSYEKSEKNPISVKCGTPGFIAPEILNTVPNNVSQVLDSKVDVYSTGIILYHMLFGDEAFEWDELFELVEKNSKGEWRLKEIREMITEEKSEEAFDLMKKMIEMEPGKRISVGEALCHPFFCEVNSTCRESERKEFDEENEAQFRFFEEF